MLSSLYAKLATLGGIVLAIFAALGIAKRSGKKEEQADETAKSLQQSKESNEIDAKVRAMSQSDLDKRLHMDDRD